jgi:C1A family cysteine protease
MPPTMPTTANDYVARKYGWVRDIPDQRDRRFNLASVGLFDGASLPTSIDLRPGCPPVFDQGELGSCTANATCGALEFDAIKQGQPPVNFSRLFVYWNTRNIEGTDASDSGAAIRNAIKSVVQWGAPPESDWPYDPAVFATQPPVPTYATAGKHLALIYESVPQELQSLKACLAAGFPIVFGFSVYQSFEGPEVAKTGIVKMPHWFEAAVGGHAVMAVGYDDAAQYFIVRNSWGSDWGSAGYFYFPYPYMTGQLSSDFWTIRSVM